MKFTFASRPWSLSDSAVRLCDGADHLLHDHGCDEHGYETLIAARDSMREMLPELIDAQNIADFWAQAHADLERLTAERAVLLAPVEGVDMVKMAQALRDIEAAAYTTDNGGCCDRCGAWAPHGHPEAHDHMDECGVLQERATEARAALRKAAPALAREVARLRDHVRRVEASEKRLMAEVEEMRLTLAAEQGRPEREAERLDRKQGGRTT